MTPVETVALQAWLDGKWVELEDYEVELAFLAENDIIEAPEDEADRNLNDAVKRMAMIMLAEVTLRQWQREDALRG